MRDTFKAKGRKPGRRPKVEQTHVLTTFPTLSMRQAHILMQCVALGMTEGVLVDGHFVTPSEWDAIIRQLVRT